jgi:hypothetical protein
MGIGGRVKEAIDKLTALDYEGALESALLAAAAASTRTHRKLKKDNERFKAFIRANQHIIYKHTFVIDIAPGANATIRFGYTHPDLKPPGDFHSLEEILYLIRNHKIHQSVLPCKIEVTPENRLGGDPFAVPVSVIYGLLAAVIVQPENRLDYVPPSYMLILNGSTAVLNDYWGKEEKYLTWFEDAQMRGAGQGNTA